MPKRSCQVGASRSDFATALRRLDIQLDTLGRTLAHSHND